jgi:MFS family permease
MGLLVLVIFIPAVIFLKRDPSKIGQRAYGDSDPVGAGQVTQDGGMIFREAIRTRQFWTLCIIYICYGFFVQSILVHIVPHARTMGFDAGSAALILSFLGLGSIVGRIVMGSISDRVGFKYTLVMALGLILITFVGLLSANSLWMLYLLTTIYGFGYGALIAMQAMAPASMFGLVSLGTLVGVTTFAYTSGGTIGPIVTGYIFDITGSYEPAFIIFAALAATGLALTLTLSQPDRKARN